MVNVNAQQWLDEKYPKDGICKRDNDPENKGKKREEITTLDISQGKVGNNYFGNGKTLAGSLGLKGFTNLRKLMIFSHQLISLDLSDCPNLEELDCHDNELTSLKVDGCSNLKRINCFNSYIRKLELNTCSNLEEVDINNCLNLTMEEIKSNLTYDIEKGKLMRNLAGAKNISQITPAGENDIRNILIVGWTGNGKSTLANVLTSANHFTEKNSSVSITNNFQKSEIFEWQGKKYCVIDNVGFGDTSNLAEEDILFKIGEGIHSAKEGINQVLFVVKGKFSDEQIIAFDTFKNFIAESGITNFTTIIKTGFKDFRSSQECDKDRQDLRIQTKKIRIIIDSCHNIIHVDNPPIPETDEEDSDNEQEIKISNKKRKESRERVLKHLSENCLEIYKLKEWDSIYSMVDNYIKRKQEIERSNSSTKEKQLKQEWNEVTKGIKVGLGFELPTFGGFNASVEYNTQRKKYSPTQNPAYIDQPDFGSSSQAELPRKERKLSKTSETQETQSELMEIDGMEQIAQIESLPK